jgi:glucokinase
MPGATRIEAIISISGEAHSTFTDALLTYERQAGISLRGAECVLAIPAPPAGDAIPVARSRWTISRSGLNAMFGRPVAVINDVAATAWSLLGTPGNLEQFHGPPFDFTKPGRWAVVLIDDGVNAAALDVAEDGRCHVTDSEAGNAGFAPSDEAQLDLLRSLGVRHRHVCWEMALNSAWSGANAPPADRDAWAVMAGAFVGDCALQLGAWSGVILTGRHCAALRDPARLALFNRSMENKNRYGRFIAGGSRGFLATRDPLAGALSLLSARRAARLN